MMKSLDNKGRWRAKTVSFRVSSEEAKDLDTRVRLSGLTKQEYIVCRLQERDVIVQPNSRLFKAMRDGIREILSELKRIEKSDEVTDEMLDTINLLAKTYHDLEEK